MATVSFNYSKTEGGVVIEGYDGSTPVVDVPDTIAGTNVVKIGARAFAGRREIKRINIPYCVKEIAVDAFAGCTCLKEISWQAKTIKLGGDSVKICGSYEIQVPKFFVVAKEQKESASSVPVRLLKTPVADFEYSETDSGIMIEKYLGTASAVVVPEKIDGVSVVRIGFDAFGGCRALRVIRLPADLNYVDQRAFDGCSSLRIAYLPRSLDSKVTDGIIDALPPGCNIRYT